MRLTEPRKNVLRNLSKHGGKASAYDLAYPRSHMMHALQIGGLVTVEGKANTWGEPCYPDGVYVLTEAGRAALSGEKQ